jgi:hypothetical protein
MNDKAAGVGDVRGFGGVFLAADAGQYLKIGFGVARRHVSFLSRA